MSLIARINPVIRQWPLFAMGASLAMLGAAHSFERFGNMPPCALCLHQREAYWAAVGVAVVGLLATKYKPDPLASRAFSLLLAFAFGAGALIAGFHVGVEFKWWPGLPECTGGGPIDPNADILGTLSKSMDVPACDEVAWSLLGISMAGWNMLISAGLMCASILALFFPKGFKGVSQNV
jgi:disulfide bond formation protein DsbB